MSLLITAAEVMSLKDIAGSPWTGFSKGETVSFTKTTDGKYFPSGGENRVAMDLQKIGDFIIDDGSWEYENKGTDFECLPIKDLVSFTSILQKQIKDNDEIEMPKFTIVGQIARGTTMKYLEHPQKGMDRIAYYEAEGIPYSKDKVFPMHCLKKDNTGFLSTRLVVTIAE